MHPLFQFNDLGVTVLKIRPPFLRLQAKGLPPIPGQKYVCQLTSKGEIKVKGEIGTLVYKNYESFRKHFKQGHWYVNDDLVRFYY